MFYIFFSTAISSQLLLKTSLIFINMEKDKVCLLGTPL